MLQLPSPRAAGHLQFCRLCFSPDLKGPYRKMRALLGLPQCFPESGLMRTSGKAEAAEAEVGEQGSHSGSWNHWDFSKASGCPWMGLWED